ncbi:ATP-grasp domain-containing protein [Actinokineospora sp. 24-640]
MTEANTAATVVVVDPYSSGDQLAPALRAAGLVPVAVITSDPPPPIFAGCVPTEDFARVVVHGPSVADTADRLRHLAPLAVVPGAESGVELADRLAALLTPALANDPARTDARRHKGAMGQAVAAAGLPCARQVCTGDPEEVAAWIARDGLAGVDLVMKPPKSAATDNVIRVRAGDDWRAAFHAVLDKRDKFGEINTEVVVQELLVGTEYVVDTVTADGVHTVVNICRYRKLDIGDHMAVYDYVEWLPSDTPGHDTLTAYTAAVLDAVGMRFGAAHNEIMLTADGPRLIEVNARLAGGGTPRFAREATGDSQVDRMVRYCAGDRDIPAGYDLHKTVWAVLFMARTGGIVRNAEEYERIRDLPSAHLCSVKVRNGDHVPVTRDLVDSHTLGFAILSHESPEQVAADHAEIRRIEQRLRFDPIPPAAGDERAAGRVAEAPAMA